MGVAMMETGEKVRAIIGKEPTGSGRTFSATEQESVRGLTHELRRKPDRPKSESECSIHPWYGLPEISDGEMRYGLSPIERLAFMITKTYFKKATLEILLFHGRDGRGLEVLLGEMAGNVAVELMLNGTGKEEHNLTGRQCFLLRNLIGIGEDGKQQPPKSIIEFGAVGKDGMRELVEAETAPLMRFIREKFGGEITDYFDLVREEKGILVSF